MELFNRDLLFQFCKQQKIRLESSQVAELESFLELQLEKQVKQCILQRDDQFQLKYEQSQRGDSSLQHQGQIQD